MLLKKDQFLQNSRATQVPLSPSYYLSAIKYSYRMGKFRVPCKTDIWNLLISWLFI